MTPGTASERARAAYDALAPVWGHDTDDNLWNEALDRRPIRSLLPSSLRGVVVLDAGTAAGTMAMHLLELGADVVGIDLSTEMLDTASRRCHGRGAFLAADLDQPLPFVDETFDGIVASLVLHYLEDWTVALGSFARVLRPGGWLIVSLDHPDSEFSRETRTSYFATELVTDRWSKGGIDVEVAFWRRPLSSVINAFADAGFVLDRLIEPQASEADRRRFPEDAAQLGDQPLRVIFRCRKPLRGERSPFRSGGCDGAGPSAS